MLRSEESVRELAERCSISQTKVQRWRKREVVIRRCAIAGRTILAMGRAVLDRNKARKTVGPRVGCVSGPDGRMVNRMVPAPR